YRDLEKPVQKTASSTADFACTAEPIRVFMGGNRRDITTLLPNDEIQIFMRWHDFQGRYVMHCHNVVHEDHAMMIRWDIVPAGKGKGPGEAAPSLVPKRRMQHPG